jgi:hypothetical protein
MTPPDMVLLPLFDRLGLRAGTPAGKARILAEKPRRPRRG